VLSIKAVNPLIFSNPLAIEASQSTINIDKKINKNNNKKSNNFYTPTTMAFFILFPTIILATKTDGE
jgi:hypothetical protein